MVFSNIRNYVITTLYYPGVESRGKGEERKREENGGGQGGRDGGKEEEEGG